MASFFGKLNIGDEIDKFEKTTREGTDALTMIRKRGRDDRSRTSISPPQRGKSSAPKILSSMVAIWLAQPAPASSMSSNAPVLTAPVVGCAAKALS
jgi:hypothetical protein